MSVDRVIAEAMLSHGAQVLVAAARDGTLDRVLAAQDDDPSDIPKVPRMQRGGAT